MSLLAAAALAGLFATAGGLLGWLTRGGVITASLVGTAVLQGAGFGGGVMVALFFVSGSIMTKWSERSGLVPHDAKGSRRDAAQVAANGAWAAVGALAIHASPATGWSVLTGAVAAAQADTWATEIGARSIARPRLITSGESVAPGTSGGVTALGTTGGAAGAIVIALVAVAFAVPAPAALAGILGGCLGMIADSVLGATGQAVFANGKERAVEPRVGSGPRPRPVRGFAWCTNDVVNLTGTGAGAAVGLGLSWLWTLA